MSKSISHQVFFGLVKSILTEEEHEELDSLKERARKAHEKLKAEGETETKRAKRLQHQITCLESFNAFDLE